MRKHNTAITVLACLAVFAVMFAGAYLVAKMVSNVDGASGTADVAAWTVSRDYSDNPHDPSLIAGNDTATDTYILKVTSTSEVSASYSIVLTNVPADLKVRIDNSPTYETPVNNTVTFSDSSYTINLNDSNKTKTHTLEFFMPIDLPFNATNNIGIELKFDQID